MVSLGVDYGTGSWKTALFGNVGPPERRIFGAPEAVRAYIEEIDRLHPGLPIVLPSGFGIPVKRVQELDDRDRFEIALRRDAPSERGLSHFLLALQVSRVNAYCIPAVKLLPSVPIHRKINRVDMGTSDKLCAAAYLISRSHERGPRLEEIDFILLEVGAAFRAIVAVQGGKIVDGLGGMGSWRISTNGTARSRSIVEGLTTSRSVSAATGTRRSWRSSKRTSWRSSISTG
jgi:predicted butyrate kinase (DUF1464 family)